MVIQAYSDSAQLWATVTRSPGAAADCTIAASEPGAGRRPRTRYTRGIRLLSGANNKLGDKLRSRQAERRQLALSKVTQIPQIPQLPRVRDDSQVPSPKEPMTDKSWGKKSATLWARRRSEMAHLSKLQSSLNVQALKQKWRCRNLRRVSP